MCDTAVPEMQKNLWLPCYERKVLCGLQHLKSNAAPLMLCICGHVAKVGALLQHRGSLMSASETGRHNQEPLRHLR